MSLLALGLLLVAAALHTGWNLLLKITANKQLFSWLALCSGASCALPFLLLTSDWSAGFPTQLWLFVVASAVVETIYYIVLVRAYATADFSLVYPLARGTAPVFLAVWNIGLVGVLPSWGGLLGLTLIVGGLFTVSAQSVVALFRNSSGKSGLGLGLAFIVALCISIYTVIDGIAVRMAAPPTAYTVFVFILTALFLTPFVLTTYSLQVVVAEWQANRWRILLVGLLTIATYVLVLQAYRLANLSYAGAVREISIVFAAFVGWRWLGEEFGKFRLIGAFLIFGGIFVIAILG